MNCEQCGKECEPVRATGLYCSTACKQRAYRNRHKPGVTLKNDSVTVTADESVTLNDPLKLYSAEHWASLQAKGYSMPSGDYDGQMNLEGEIPEGARLGYACTVISVWHDSNGTRHTEYQWAVPVPGDPAYDHQTGRCRTCGAITQIKSITKCHKCVDAA